jgi:preprotein translocase subunit SecD
MNTTTTKIAILSLVLVLIASACSRTARLGRSFALDPNKPQFLIAPADLASPAVIATNSSPSGANATIVIRVEFNADKGDEFRKFTREHLNQQTQLVVGAKVVAEPVIVAEISDGRTDMAFTAFDEAWAVRTLLSKK